MTALVVRRRRGGLTIGDLLDGLIIMSGTWLVSWIVFVEPFVNSSAEPTSALVINALYLPTAMPLIALAALLVFGSGRPTTSVLLLASGLMLNVFGDLIYALDATRSLGGWAYTVADIFYVFSVATCAGAFFHPTASSLLGVSAVPRDSALPGRLALTTTSLIAPVVLVAFIPAETSTDRWIRTLSALATLGFVGVRLYTATRSQLRSQHDLVRAAHTDELTGLSNKRALLAVATDHIDEAWTTTRSALLLSVRPRRVQEHQRRLGPCARRRDPHRGGRSPEARCPGHERHRRPAVGRRVRRVRPDTDERARGTAQRVGAALGVRSPAVDVARRDRGHRDLRRGVHARGIPDAGGRTAPLGRHRHVPGEGGRTQRRRAVRACDAGPGRPHACRSNTRSAGPSSATS